jgi:hypothetical protein
VRTQYDLSALRLMVHMGAPCPPWLKEALDHLAGARARP